MGSHVWAVDAVGHAVQYRTALKENHDQETRYYREVVDRLKKEYQQLEQRLEAMYVDKLDGKIGERFYEQKSAEWREDLKDILRRVGNAVCWNSYYRTRSGPVAS